MHIVSFIVELSGAVFSCEKGKRLIRVWLFYIHFCYHCHKIRWQTTFADDLSKQFQWNYFWIFIVAQYSFKCEDNAHWPVAAQVWMLRFVQPWVAVEFLVDCNHVLYKNANSNYESFITLNVSSIHLQSDVLMSCVFQLQPVNWILQLCLHVSVHVCQLVMWSQLGKDYLYWVTQLT